jgi:hypothetical protein
MKFLDETLGGEKLLATLPIIEIASKFVMDVIQQLRGY